MIKLLKPLSFLPALCLMYMIFTFSAQDGTTSAQLSYKVGYKLIEVGGEVLGAEFEPWEIDSLAVRFNGAIRKIAHMTEYFALAVAVSFPLYVYGLRGIWLMLVAGFLCVAFACGDEYHQSYVAGRGPSKRDVLIDSFGVFWGIILVRIIGWTGRKTIFRPFCRKKKKTAEIPQHQNPPYPYQPYPNQPYPNQPYPNGTYANQSHPEAMSYYPPRSGNYNTENYTNNTYSYGSVPHGAQHRPERTTSDRLSEDMSLRKLMHDLKEQKTDRKSQS